MFSNATNSAIFKILTGLVWWHIPIIPALGKQRQEDYEFKTLLGYLVSSRPVCAT
jgi:hypothetical protein